MLKNSQKGFTLIELLVVIAIIGVLSAVVLGALNSARTKGANSVIKSNLANARAQAELYYDAMETTPTGLSYSGLCGTTAAPGGVKTIQSFVISASAQSPAGTNICYAIGAACTQTDTTRSVCHASTAVPWAYAVSVPLKTPENGNLYWCVDSRGFSGGRISPISAVGSTVCPAT